MQIEPMPPSPRASRAHALKNCLSVVRAVNRLLEAELSDRSRERLARSEQAVERMLSLLQDDLTKDGADRQPSRGFVRAEEVLRAVVARVEDRAQAGGVELFTRAGTGGVTGDRDELTEALANIALNAVEATPPGGAVHMATHELPDGSQVWAVLDTGHGMPEDVEQRLGCAFVTGRKEGSGVGFAFARQVVTKYGGQIHVRSMRGTGTVISMRLPASGLLSL